MKRPSPVRATGMATAMAALMVPALASPASAKEEDRSAVVRVTASGEDLTLNRTTVRGSVVTLDLDVTHDGNASIQVLQLRSGVTLRQLIGVLEAQIGGGEATPAEVAASTRALDAMATWYGGVSTNNGQDDAATTLRLQRGSYLVIDFAQLERGGFDALDARTLTVTSNGKHGAKLKASARVEMRDSDDGPAGHGHRFDAPAVLPAAGTVEFRNRDDIVHFADLVAVKPGTTDAQIRAAFAAFARGEDVPAADIPFLPEDRDFAGMNVLSAGKEALLTYDLPKGTYVLLCFVGDERTGDPHAFLGMFKIVTLR